MRHYSHLARDRMQKTGNGLPMEFECSSALDKEAERELHAAIGGGAFSRRLSDFTQGLVIEEQEN